MTLGTVGRLLAQHRRAKGLSLREVATAARVGRSTLAALEAGTIAELGYAKVARLCEALGLVLEARPPILEAPLLAHRHLTEPAGRELTKAAIEDVISRGNVAAWRGLVRAVRSDPSGKLDRRMREVVSALAQHDVNARALQALLPRLLARGRRR